MILIGVVSILVLMGMMVFGAIWTSTLFSDARGKLGNQVVFSNWKGRTTMRAYKVPANPNTLGQQAQRSKNAQAVVGYQDFLAPESTAVTYWNALALPRQISGFNLFMKYALKMDIASLTGGAAPFDNTVTYTANVDLSAMGMYRTKDGAELTEIVAKGQLESGVDKTIEDNDLPAGLYHYYLGPADVFADLEGAPEKSVQCAHWKNNIATGISDPAITEAT